MMRFFIVLALCIFAVIIAPSVLNVEGYILIALSDLTIEISIVTATILLIASFLALIFAIAFLRGSIKLSSLTWNKVAFASRRKALRNFQQGLVSYLLGDHAKAEKLLSKSADSLTSYQGMVDTAWLGAASAANQQGLTANTKHYLQLIDQNSDKYTKVTIESLILKVQLLFKEEDFDKARTLLDDNHKLLGHDGRLLAVEIDLCLIEKRYQAAIDHLVDARKRKDLTNEQLIAWEDKAFYGQFDALLTQHSLGELEEYWQGLNKKVRQREAVILAYANTLAKHQISDKFIDLLLPSFGKNASSGFIHQAKKLPLRRAQKLIEAIEKQLHKSPDNPLWLSALAHVATSSEDYNLARKAFTSLFHIERKAEDLTVYAKVLEQSGEYQQANKVYQEILA